MEAVITAQTYGFRSVFDKQQVSSPTFKQV